MSDKGWSDVVEGCTDPLIHGLLVGGAVTDLSAYTLSAVCKDKDGTVVDVTALVAWDNAALARAKLTPAAGTFLGTKSPYRIHWKATAGSVILGFPRGQAREIRVSKAGGA